MITATSLVHPTMIAKIRQGLHYAIKSEGHKMGGHGNRVYIKNAKGHAIMRLDWKGKGKFVAYGGAGWGQTEVTEIVKEALQRGCSANRVKPRAFRCDDIPATPSPAAKAFISGNKSLQKRLAELRNLAGIGAAKVAVIGLALSSMSGGFI
jgi:hypothetical protein